MEQVDVETGISSSTQTEIVSGLSEGDEIVTSVVFSTTNGQQRSGQTQSPFSSFGGGGSIRMGR